MAQEVQNLPAKAGEAGDWVQSLSWKIPGE